VSVPRRHDESQTTSAAQQSIAEAKERLDNAVRGFAQAQQLADQHQAVASQELHIAILDLFWRLRTHLYQESDAWRNLHGYTEVDDGRSIIWSGRHPHVNGEVRIEGLRDLDDWFSKEVTVEGGGGGPLSTSSKSYTTTIALPAGAAIDVAKILLLEYEQFSLGIDVSMEQQTKIDNELMEEVKQWRRQNV